jgi:flagellar hook-associated protein 2
MSGISSGVGLASGINTSAIIEQLLAIDARAKTPFQTQITRTQGSKTALLDVNARLLAIRSASTKFRLGRVFEQMTAKSNDESVLAATAKAGTPSGNYAFNVSRLSSTSQVLSRGFTSRDATPLGVTSMTFEFGDAAIARSQILNSLRGGQGVGQGSIKVTDRAGQSATIDLASAVTLDDIVTKINESESVSVVASIENEALVLRDSSGGSGQFSVTNVGGGTIGTRLGIAKSVASSVITGDGLGTLSMDATLADLNDGNGVLVRDVTTDFRITNGATTYDIDLGRTNLPITATSKLSDLNNGVGVRINNTDADDFTVVTSTGVSVGVNLGAVVVDGEVTTPAVTTVGELVSRVNARLSQVLGSSTAVVLSLRADGTGFNLADTLGGANPVKVLAAGPNGDKAAKDLGIFTGAITTGPATITGSAIPNRVSKPRAATVQDVADRIFEQTLGKVRVEINTAGTGLRLVSTDGQSIAVLAGTVDGSSFGTAVGERTARDLGILGLTGTGSVEGSRISAGVSTVRTANLNGGKGIAAGVAMNVTDRSGNTFNFSNFAAYDTLDALLRGINAEAAANNVSVTLSLGQNGRSIVASDSSGGTGDIAFSGPGAKQLGIMGNATASQLRGEDLDRQYISLATSLSSLNFGRGTGTGIFTITDSAGVSGTIDIDTSDLTVYDVISEINSRGLFVEARLNDSGDGILLVDTNTGTPAQGMTVKDTSGTVAKSLGLVKTAASPGDDIDGSFERTVSFAATDTLNDIISKIKSANIGINASVINSGTGANPFRMSLTSQVAGSRGQLLIESAGTDLGLARTSEGRDAAIVLGGGVVSESPFIFTSSTNTFEDILSGLQVTVKKTGAATVEVADDRNGMVAAVQAWVKSINDVITKIADYDKYDSTTRVKGPLFGNSTVSIVRQQLLTTVQSRARGVDGSITSLTQLGIKVGAKSLLVMDEDRLRAQLDANPAAVAEAFTAFEVQAVTSTSSVPGVTVASETRTTYSKLGFGDMVDQLLQRITNTVDGTVTQADRNFQKQIEALNKRISAVDARIESKRARYERQFAAMERSIARVQSQQSALSSLPAMSF